ncbi:MAG: hypothetical protein QY326_04775 [Bdellovibrionota bacterium]|nr:MAG: hypothetical protein QY326_04775 [Bdellovibrionota bacterium]
MFQDLPQDVANPPAIVAPAPADSTYAMREGNLATTQPTDRDLVFAQQAGVAPQQQTAQPAATPGERLLRSDPSGFSRNQPQPGNAGFNPNGVNIIARGNLLREALANPSQTQLTHDPAAFHPGLAPGHERNFQDSHVRVVANDLYRQLDRRSFMTDRDKVTVYELMDLMGHRNQQAMSPHTTQLMAQELGRQVQANWVQTFPGQNAPADPKVCLAAYLDQVAQDPAAAKEFFGIGTSQPFDAAHVAGEVSKLVNERLAGGDLAALQERFVDLFNRPIRDHEVRALGSELARLGVTEDSLRAIDPNGRLFVLTSLYGTEMSRVTGMHSGLARADEPTVESNARSIPESGADRFRTAYRELRDISVEQEMAASGLDKTGDAYINSALAVQGINPWHRAETFAHAFNTGDTVTLAVETRRLPQNDPVVAGQIRELMQRDHNVNPVEQIVTRVADPAVRAEMLSPWLAPEAAALNATLDGIGSRRANEPASTYVAEMDQRMAHMRAILSDQNTASVIVSKVPDFNRRLEEQLQLVAASTERSPDIAPDAGRALRIEAAATYNALNNGVPVEGTRGALLALDNALTGKNYDDLRDTMRAIPAELRPQMTALYERYVNRSGTFDAKVTEAMGADNARRIGNLQRGLDTDALVDGLQGDISRISQLGVLRDDQLAEVAWAYQQTTGRSLMLDARVNVAEDPAAKQERANALIGTPEQPGLVVRLYGRELLSSVAGIQAQLDNEQGLMAVMYSVPNAQLPRLLELYDIYQGQRNADGTARTNVLRQELQARNYGQALQLLEQKLSGQIADAQQAPAAQNGASRPAAAPAGAAPAPSQEATRQMIQAGIIRPEVGLAEPKLELLTSTSPFDRRETRYHFNGGLDVALNNPSAQPMAVAVNVFVQGPDGKRYTIDNGTQEKWEGTLQPGEQRKIDIEFYDGGANVGPNASLVVEVVTNGRAEEYSIPVSTTTRPHGGGLR